MTIAKEAIEQVLLCEGKKIMTTSIYILHIANHLEKTIKLYFSSPQLRFSPVLSKSLLYVTVSNNFSNLTFIRIICSSHHHKRFKFDKLLLTVTYKSDFESTGENLS